jgi:hypothetical protein
MVSHWKIYARFVIYEYFLFFNVAKVVQSSLEAACSDEHALKSSRWLKVDVMLPVASFSSSSSVPSVSGIQY